MKKIILLICCFLFVEGLFAQKNDTIKKRKNEIGIHAGFSTGVGLSYRFWPKYIGVQLTALPIKQGKDIFISAGFTILCKYYEAKYVRGFFYLGNHFLYEKNEVNDFNLLPFQNYNESSKNTYKYNIGLGTGFCFGQIVKFNIMLGYGAYDVTGEFNLFPTAEMGLYYCF